MEKSMQNKVLEGLMGFETAKPQRKKNGGRKHEGIQVLAKSKLDNMCNPFKAKREVKFGSKQMSVDVSGSLSESIIDGVFTPGTGAFKGHTPVVGVDCEMVEVDKTDDALARVSIVNYNGVVLYDKYVRPEGRVSDFRTWVSGVTPHHLKEASGAITFAQAKKETYEILSNKIVVGHSLWHDFTVLELHKEKLTFADALVAGVEQGDVDAENNNKLDKMGIKVRDLTRYPTYKSDSGQTVSLKNLTQKFLHRQIQTGQHSSVIDAKASVALYRINEKDWENIERQKAYSQACKDTKSKLVTDWKKNKQRGDQSEKPKLNKKAKARLALTF